MMVTKDSKLQESSKQITVWTKQIASWLIHYPNSKAQKNGAVLTLPMAMSWKENTH